MHSLRIQLVAVIVGVSGLSGAIVGIPLYVEATSMLRQTLVERLVGVAETAALGIPVSALEAPPDDPALVALRDWLAQVRFEAGLRGIWLVARDGHLIVGDRVPTARDEAALAIAWTGESAWTGTYPGDAGESLQTAYAPIDADGDGTEDAALAVEGEEDALDRLARIRWWFAAAAGGWLGLLGSGAVLASRAIVAPIRALAVAAAAVARGTPPLSLPRATSREIEALRASFVTMADAVARREAWLRSLAGAVAHEVRTPANGARLQLGLARRDLAGAPDGVRRRLEIVEGELDRLEETVASFVAFAREGTVVRRSVLLGTWLRSVAPSVPVDAPDDNVEIDPVLLGRAIANLVLNAGQAGGRPTIRATSNGDRWILTVTDDGRGFPAHLVAHAFEPFTTGRPDGTGLGLAVVEAIVRAHGGRVAITRAGPEGTVITLDLPARGGSRD